MAKRHAFASERTLQRSARHADFGGGGAAAVRARGLSRRGVFPPTLAC